MTKLSKSQEQTSEQELTAQLQMDGTQTKQVMYLSCTSSVSSELCYESPTSCSMSLILHVH